MAYASAPELRARYRQGLDGIDEFAEREDADLPQSLAAASAEIDSWRPQGTLGAAAMEVLRDKAMVLARLLIYQAQTIDPEHPIVREATEVRAWLRRLSTGAVHLPTDGIASTTLAAPTRTMVYDAAWDAKYTLP